MTFTFTYCFLKVTWGPHGSKAAEMLFQMQIMGALLVCNVSRLKKKKKKQYRWTCLQVRNRDAEIENKPVSLVEEGEGGMNWERSLTDATTMCEAAGGKLLCDRSSAWRWATAWRGGVGGGLHWDVCIHAADSHCSTAEARLPWWPRWLSVSPQCRRPRFDPCVGKIPMRSEWQPINVTNCFRTTQFFLPNVPANSNRVLLRGTHIPLICKIFITWNFKKLDFASPLPNVKW